MKNKLTLYETLSLYKNIAQELTDEEYLVAAKELCKKDLYFLLTQGMNRQDMINEWCYSRTREVEAAPDSHIDLWSRGHYKSTIITFGLTIQEILRDPSITIGIFSHTRALAKKFVEQIKTELESNKFLIELFPNILNTDPNKYLKWSTESGLRVKRRINKAAETIEACGIIEGMPTGRHYDILVFDDVVTERATTTPDIIEKVLSQWELSLNLSHEQSRFRYIGTRYAAHDLYDEIIKRKSAIPRVRIGIEKGGKTLLWSREFAEEKRKSMGSITWAAQILQDPTAENNAEFNPKWLRYYGIKTGYGRYNKYILVDPASTKTRRSDYTAMLVFGVGSDNNYYILDLVRDKLNLTERAKTLFDLVEKYRPLKVGYEKYGMMSDIDHIKYMMEQESFRFPIIELSGTMKKEDRIRRLVPLFEQGRIYLPYENEITHIDFEGKIYDPTRKFIEEFEKFPYSPKDDILDVASRMVEKDMGIRAPNRDSSKSRVKKTKVYDIFAR